MPASVPGSPAPRSPGLALLVEQVARAIARARAQHGDVAVHGRVESAISPDDAATTERVLRALGSELDGAPLDLDALDARLRAAGAHADGDADAGSLPATRADGSAGEAAAPPVDPRERRRPVPPTGLRSALRRHRR